jgi:hypothetical protein
VIGHSFSPSYRHNNLAWPLILEHPLLAASADQQGNRGRCLPAPYLI